MSIYDYKPENILFLDIETVPQYEDYSSLPDDFKLLWDKKAKLLVKEDEKITSSGIYQKAGIYSEFGKVICISVGNLSFSENKKNLRIKSFYSENEKSILEEFCKMLENFSHNREIYLAAHNGKEFDFPYIARRIVINGLKLPKLLQVAGKKPWEVTFIDTLELWKFGDYKHYTSLDLLTYILGIPSPKDDIDGSMVAEIYYKEKNLERIVKYCEKDVVALTQVFLKFRGKVLLRRKI
jgi:hypothetical protein